MCLRAVEAKSAGPEPARGHLNEATLFENERSKKALKVLFVVKLLTGIAVSVWKLVTMFHG